VADLDEEALAVLQRAQPFPPLPGNRVNGEQINLSVPIRFKLK
jgi:TonB family protein